MKPENMSPEQRGMAFEEYIDVSSRSVPFIANCMSLTVSHHLFRKLLMVVTCLT